MDGLILFPWECCSSSGSPNGVYEDTQWSGRTEGFFDGDGDGDGEGGDVNLCESRRCKYLSLIRIVMPHQLVRYDESARHHIPDSLFSFTRHNGQTSGKTAEQQWIDFDDTRRASNQRTCPITGTAIELSHH